MGNAQSKQVEQYNLHEVESIDQALEFLNHVAKNNSQEIKRKMGSNFKVLKNVILSSEEEAPKDFAKNIQSFKEKLINNELNKKVVENVKKAGAQVDKTAHQSPWYFVGTAALMGSAVGLFLGGKLARPHK